MAPVTGFASWFTGGSSSYRFEEAGELYIQAANLQRINKKYTSAGELFEKAAAAQRKADSIDEAGNTLIEAYKSYKDSTPMDAARVLKESIAIFTTKGQFRRAANFKMDLASIYEEQGELNSNKEYMNEAVSHYEQAGEWYASDQAQALANKAFLSAADLTAVLGNYIDAAKLYENVAKKSINNQLSKWSLKDYFFKACLCYLAADDVVASKKAIGTFIDWDPSFQQTKEFVLLNDLFDAIDSRDAQAFSDKLYDYDQFNKLDKWKVSILSKIKNAIVEADDDIL